MGDAAFLDFGDEVAEPEADVGDFAVFGFGALGFLVGPALFDFLAFDGDFGFAAEETDVVAAFEETDFLLSTADFFDLAAAKAAVFFSAAVFFAFGEIFLEAFEEAAAAVFSDAAVVARLLGDFFALAAATAVFFFSAAAALAELFTDPPDEADANLNEPEAPFPLV